MMKTFPSIGLMLAAVCVLSGLAACTTSDPDDQESTDMYCELIDPATVAPITGDHKITTHGGPSAKKETRTINCSLSAPGIHQPVLSVYSFELWNEDAATREHEKMETWMAEQSAEHPDHYQVIDGDGVDLGFRTYLNGSVQVQVLTEQRSISVVVPAEEAQFAEFAEAATQVALEFDSNLDTWDEANPSD